MAEILYLHGFASGPGSTKARFFARNFDQIGGRVHCPDLAEGDFRGLTVTKQLEVVDRVAREVQPDLVMGSSLGGYLAALYAAAQPQLAPALVLLAPAFGFPRRWSERLGAAKMMEWRKKDALDVYHYGEGAMRQVGYELYQDALRHDDLPDVRQPTLILHGKRDEDVDPELSVQFATGKPNVQLELLDSDHRLTDVLDSLWRRVVDFYLQRETMRAAGA